MDKETIQVQHPYLAPPPVYFFAILYFAFVVTPPTQTTSPTEGKANILE